MLLVKNEQGRSVESLSSYKNKIEQQYSGITVSSWNLVSDHEASVTIAQNAPTGTLYGEEKISAPRKAWYNCMSDHGIEGTVAGAVAGCGASAEIGCIEGAAPAGLFGSLGGLVAGIWACRSKW